MRSGSSGKGGVGGGDGPLNGGGDGDEVGGSGVDGMLDGDGGLIGELLLSVSAVTVVGFFCFFVGIRLIRLLLVHGFLERVFFNTMVATEGEGDEGVGGETFFFDSFLSALAGAEDAVNTSL